MASIAAVATSFPKGSVNARESGSMDLIEFLFAQHVTQLSVCELLAKLVVDHHNATASYDAAAVIDCFAEWMPMHDAIEEQHLLELVNRRSLPGDDIDGLVAQLRLGHQESRLLADELMAGLHDIATGRELKNAHEFRATAIALCSHHRALVQWEDEVLYPFVRQRLDVSDLDELATVIARGRCAAQLPSWPALAEESYGRH